MVTSESHKDRKLLTTKLKTIKMGINHIILDMSHTFFSFYRIVIVQHSCENVVKLEEGVLGKNTARR